MAETITSKLEVLQDPSYYPQDPHIDFVMQAQVLQNMGYPVYIDVIAVDQVPSHEANNDFSYYLENNYPWLKITYSLELAKFWEASNELSSAFKLEDDDLNDNFAHHPIRLMFDITFGKLDFVMDQLQHVYEYGRPTAELFHRDVTYPWQDVLEKIYMLCWERRDVFKPEDATEPFYTMLFYKEELLYNQLVQNGVQPLNNEQLAGIVADFYQLAEEYFPEFRKLANHI